MINVNQKFIDSCNSDVVASQYKIKLSTNKVGTVLCTLNDDEFDISTGGIQRQASSGSACNIGGVCSTRLKITINQKGIDKISNVDGFKKNYVLHLIQWNKVDDANQSPSDYSENLDHSENQTGKCDLGFYYISEIDNNYYNCSITAYDGMIAFERSFTITQLKYMRKNNKSIDGWLAYLCGLVQDANINISYVDSGINVNTGFTFNLSEDSSFDTIRDAISQLAQLKMAYATINSDGNLTLHRGIQTNISTFADEIDNEYMFSCDNDVVESVVGYFYTSIAGFEYENTYTDQQGRNVINLYLAENKFLRGNEPYNGTGLSSNTLNCLRNMSTAIMGYSFFSCDCEVNARPYLELGDVVQIERKFVDSEGQATIQQIPCVIDSVDNQIGATTHLTSNSTVSTNSSSSSKGMNSATPAVNSSPKEPSSSDVYNDINTELTSPVTTYSDTTATVRIRVDNQGSENLTRLGQIKEFFANYSPTYDSENKVNNSESIGGIISNKHNNYYDANKYIYNADFDASTLTSLKTSLKVEVKTKNIKGLIGLTCPVRYAISFIYTFGTISDVSFNCNNGGAETFIQYFLGKNPAYNTQSDGYFYTGEISGYSSATIKHRVGEIANSMIGLSSGSYPDGSTYKTEFDVDYSSLTSSQKETFLNDIKGTSGFTTFLHSFSANVKINPYVTGWADLYRYYVVLAVVAPYINFRIKYYDSSQVEQTTTISLYDLFGFVFNREGAIFPAQSDTNAANWINQEITDITKIIKTLAESIDVKVGPYYIDATYLTASNPISQGDKNKVDDGIVTQQDLEDVEEDLSGRIQNVESRTSELESNVSILSQGLSQAENDILTNTNNIQGLDGRVTNTEQGMLGLAGELQSQSGRITTLENNRDIEDLDNVSIASPQNGQVLGYNSTTGKWENQTSGGGGGGSTTLAGLNDVTISNPADGDGLVFDSATGKWVNQAGGGGGTTVVANPTGQASADLQKLQVGSVIYGIPSNNELVLTSEHAITLLGNNANTHMNYDKVLYQEGNNFINYDTTTGFWTVDEDTLLSVEMQSDISDSANLWLTYKIYECNSANITDIVGTMGQLYYNRTLGYIKYPIVKCRQGYYYFIAAVKANSGNWTITESNYDSTTGLYKLSNFARFVKKNGVYTPT